MLVLVFPEFTQLVPSMGSQKANALLSHFPSARAFREADVSEVARLRCTTYTKVGDALAASLVATAKTSVARYDSSAYETSVRAFCGDLDSLRRTIHDLDAEIEKIVDDHALSSVLASIDGIGTLTVARLLSRLGDPSHFRSASALASYVGVVPATNQSGLFRPGRARMSPLGNAEVRAFLWMPTLVAIKHNPWLRAYYQRLVARGKPRKLAVVAAMRKLLVAIYSVAKSRQPFVPRVEQPEVDAQESDAEAS